MMDENLVNYYDWDDLEFIEEENKRNMDRYDKNEFNKINSFIYLKKYFSFIINDIRKNKKELVNILDVGCGIAWKAVYLQIEKMLDNIDYYGCDISFNRCLKARSNFPNGIYYIIDVSLDDLPQQYDLIFDSSTLMYIQNWQNAMKNMLNHSDKWVMFNVLQITEQDKSYIKTIKAYCEDVSDEKRIEDVRNFCSIKEVRKIINDCGFEIVFEDVWDKENFLCTIVAKKIKKVKNK